MEPLVPDWEELCQALREPLRLAHYPFGLARFGLKAIQSSRRLTETAFQGGQGTRLLFRHGRSFHAASGTIPERGLRAGSGDRGTRRWLAVSARRVTKNH